MYYIITIPFDYLLYKYYVLRSTLIMYFTVYIIESSPCSSEIQQTQDQT